MDKSIETRPSSHLRLRVTTSAESILRAGHPWLFAESIRDQNRPGELGELAVIYDRKDHFLAVGLFDPDSPIRVRVLHAGRPQKLDSQWWTQRLAQALKRRRDLFNGQTTGYRCINGESDGWPGLVLDRYDTTLVLKLYTAAWLPRLEEIIGLIQKQIQAQRLVLRLSRNIADVARKTFARTDGEILCGPALAGPVIFLENRLRFEADVLRGQKTGFFLDQRDNRRRIEALARGRRVLNAFSFSGGFSLYAARGSATSVTDLDISRYALAAAKRNFGLNSSTPAIAKCSHQFVQADAFEWLTKNLQERFDLIILDPPSLAKRQSDRDAAIRAYRKLTSNGINHLSNSGILVACSCSAHVTADEFFAAIRSAAKKSGRKFSELQTTGHAPDHPATFKEAEYLKAIYLRFAR
jgi:23S rRNA (cytosine1962-C5)-methyltransferase